MLMPNLQNNDLALFARQIRQAAHGFALAVILPGAALEPSDRFKLARNATPKTALIVEGFVSECADAIMLGFLRFDRQLHQGDERLLEDVLGFGMGEAKGASIKDQLRGFSFVKLVTPAICVLFVQSTA